MLNIKIVQPASSKRALASQASACEHLVSLQVIAAHMHWERYWAEEYCTGISTKTVKLDYVAS